WPRDWRGLMPRPARPSKSATTRPPPRKSAPPPGDPAVVATTTANPPPNRRSSAPAANGVRSTPQGQPLRPRGGGPYKTSASHPTPHHPQEPRPRAYRRHRHAPGPAPPPRGWGRLQYQREPPQTQPAHG